jgi:hypothetical protein
MILEALHFAAAFVMSGRRRPSEIASSVGLWSRAKRCRKAWAPHEENCQAFVEEKVSQLVEHRTVAVLGSGLCREIPLDYLSKQFKRVELYDLVHLPAVKWLARRERLANVFFFERDLSKDLSFLNAVEGLDLVISADLVSQMGLRSDDPQRVIKNHIAELLGGSWTPCLITDIAYRVMNLEGEQVAEKDLFAGVTPPPAFKSWEWTVAPFGEEDRNLEFIHHVIAV